MTVEKEKKTEEKPKNVYKPSKLKLFKYPAQVLLEPSLHINFLDEEEVKKLNNLVVDMFFFIESDLKWGKVAGLAAPQVGKNIRMFLAIGNVFCNPVITWKTKAPLTLCYEGCYSLEKNKFDYEVKRIPSIRLRWQDTDGNFHEERFNGKQAQVIQHELDHLDGKLCCGIIDVLGHKKETKNDSTGD
jgi:peptide deformylase